MSVCWFGALCNFLEGLRFVEVSRCLSDVCLFLPCSFQSISSPVRLLLLQRNWLCASVDGSLLPPTALAERRLGEHHTSAGAQLHPSPQLCTLSQLFSLLLLGYIPALQRGSPSPPVDKLDKIYKNSKILTTRLYHRGNKARSLDNTNSLEEQGAWPHLASCRLNDWKPDPFAEFVCVKVQMKAFCFPWQPGTQFISSACVSLLLDW